MPRQPQGRAGWMPTASQCCCFKGGFRCLLFTGRGPLRRERRGREAVSRRCPRTAGLATASARGLRAFRATEDQGFEGLWISSGGPESPRGPSSR